MSEYLAAWQRLIDSDDRAGALTRHLAFLVDSPESEGRLSALLEKLIDVRIEEQRLELVFGYEQFDDECVVSLESPYFGDTSDAPASVAEVARVHNGIGWESLGGGGFGFSGFDDGCFLGGGGWEAEALTEAAQENKDFLDELDAAGLTVDDVVSPMDYGQNWLIWHPVKTNSRGEPALYFVSHGDCVAREVTRARDLAFGPLLLAIMAQEILDQDVLDEVYN
ncbi:hypothetical protein Rhe02_02760 [Rhizocola hellebori]|uniref:Uncharacterized protein n=1 Tax=Rhizocola hellebori TaxID=1392758 RepID=A0A8J3Q2D6_9ACTN|nr:hypothetical protein [Rhizocola hellebori]GIH02209.1 hypothetical protein Rhe02_02760 [Rhizocola hellebori]